jgi:exodeoxyribonuclease VII small subunit
VTDVDNSGEIGYAAALDELERILADLERDTVDVDVLSIKVARAAELLALCRHRIADARVSVDAVMVDLDTEG